KFNICRALHLRGVADIPALIHAVSTIVSRHEILRTAFHFEGILKQQVHSEKLPFSVPIDDLRRGSGRADEAEVQTRLLAEANHGFDLKEAPLFRARLMILDDQEHVLLLTFHQMVVDGWSIPIFYRELAELYEATREGRQDNLAPLPIQYADYAA